MLRCFSAPENMMNANEQMNRLSTEISDLIVKLVNDTDGPVTLAEVERVIPGFVKKDPPNWGYVIEGSKKKQLIWVGMSEAGYLALRQIIAKRRVAVQVVNILPYLLENRVINDDDWVPTMLLPARAANLEAPRRLVRVSERSRESLVEKAVAARIPGYRVLSPAPMRFTADQFSI
jgi:hypothetical protein